MKIIIIMIFALSMLIKKRNNKKNLLPIFCLFSLFIFTTSNADYETYKNIYNSYSNNAPNISFEYGYYFLSKTLSTLGLEYKYFLVIVAIIGFYLTCSTVEKFSKRSKYVYLLYFLYPFMLDIVQVRNFLAMSFIIYSARFLIRKDKKSYLLYYLFNILAMSFHIIAVVFLPLKLLINFRKEAILYLILIIDFILLFIIMTNQFNNLVGYIFTLFGKEYKYIYFTQAGLGVIIPILYQSVSLLFLNYSTPKKRTLNNRLIVPANEYNEIVYKLNLYTLILIPIYFASGIAFRAYRSIMLLNYITYSNCNDSKKRGSIAIFILIVSITDLIIPYFNLVVRHVLGV